MLTEITKKDVKSKLSLLASKITTTHLVTIILLVSLGVYFNALFNEFVYDDTDQILENPWIKDVRSIPDIFTSSVWSFQSRTTVTNYYRPMMHLIYMFNYYIFGLQPWGFHFVNIIFHTGVSVLVFVIARRLFEQSQEPVGQRDVHGAVLPAFLASLLFTTHPIHTEAVAWIAGVPDLSYTFFCLLSLAFYMRSEEGKKGLYILSIVSFAVATLCKEPALVLPFILIAYDLVFHRPLSASSPSSLWRYMPYLLIIGIYLGLRFHAIGELAPIKRHADLGTYGYIINIFPLFAEYLEKLFVPLNLNAFHVFHPISSIFDPKGLVSLGITAVFVVLAFKTLRKNSIIFFGLLVIGVPLLPSLYIPAVGENVFAERYLYLPSFGFVLLPAVVLSWARTHRPRLALSLFACLLLAAVAYSIATAHRTTIWKNDFALWTDTVRKSPEGAAPYNELGLVYLHMGNALYAVAYFEKALAIDPNLALAHCNLGNAFDELNFIDMAAGEYEKAIKIAPEFAVAHYNLGRIYYKKKMFEQAAKEFGTAISLNPLDNDAKHNLDLTLKAMN